MKSASYIDIGPDVVAQRDDLVLLDVREVSELIGPLGHIEGSVNIPLGRLHDGHVMLNPDQPIVTICKSGRRSSIAAALLVGFGYSRVHNLDGGMVAWNQAVRRAS